MVVGLGNRYLIALVASSERNQPPMFNELAAGLKSSTESTNGRSELASASLMTIGAMIGGAGSLLPGEPLTTPLGRQLAFSPQVSQEAFSLTITREKPSPSV